MADADKKTSSPAASSVVAESQTTINEKALLRKLDMRLLPALTILYLLSFLDRSNGTFSANCQNGLKLTCIVGNARLEGMTDDIHMSMYQITMYRLCPYKMLTIPAGDQYLTGLTLYFIGYVVFEIPCNIVLKKTTPRIWLPTLTLVWGIVATLLGVVENYAGYLTSRTALGIAESGLFPGVVFYLSMWYKRNEQHYRVALFFSAASLAGAFGGILAWVRLSFLQADPWKELC